AAVRRRQADARAVGQRAHPPRAALAWDRSPPRRGGAGRGARSRARGRGTRERACTRADAPAPALPRAAGGPPGAQPRAGHADAQGLRVRVGARRTGRLRPRRLTGAVDHADLARWIESYERAWRTAGTGDLGRLFTPDA